jgi:hypothetical protein
MNFLRSVRTEGPWATFGKARVYLLGVESFDTDAGCEDRHVITIDRLRFAVTSYVRRVECSRGFGIGPKRVLAAQFALVSLSESSNVGSAKWKLRK